MNNCWKRRDILTGLAAAIVGTSIAPLRAWASTKLGYCQPCTGNGGCVSGFCGSKGRCLPITNPCAGRPNKPNFKCKGTRPKCCGKDGCVSIIG